LSAGSIWEFPPLGASLLVGEQLVDQLAVNVPGAYEMAVDELLMNGAAEYETVMYEVGGDVPVRVE
jgi:hypothetical protein